MYDCYVIGSGPAGITLALELAKANKKVLLFESGTAIDARADMPNAINYGHLRDGWWDKHSIRTLGGTSKVWTGWLSAEKEKSMKGKRSAVKSKRGRGRPAKQTLAVMRGSSRHAPTHDRETRLSFA